MLASASRLFQLDSSTTSRIHDLRSRAWDSGLTCAALATVIFSLSALQVKLTGGRVPVMELCLIRSSISFCTSISVGTASRITPLFGHRQRLPLLFLRGLFGTAAISCSYVAILNLPLGDSATLSQMRPPTMAIMGHLLLGEAMGWFGAAGCLISLTGAIIVSHPPFLFGGHSDWGKHRLLGTVCGIASPLFGAGAGYCIRRIQKQEPALVVALWFHTVTVSLVVWPLIAGWPEPAAMVSARDAGLLLGLSASSFCAQLLMTRAFQLLPAARASALSFLGVVYAHAWGALIFGEALTLNTLMGGLLIFVGILLVTLKAHGATTSSSSSSSDASGSSPVKYSSSGADSQIDDPEAAVPLKAHHLQELGPSDTGTQQDQAHKPGAPTLPPPPAAAATATAAANAPEGYGSKCDIESLAACAEVQLGRTLPSAADRNQMQDAPSSTVGVQDQHTLQRIELVAPAACTAWAVQQPAQLLEAPPITSNSSGVAGMVKALGVDGPPGAPNPQPFQLSTSSIQGFSSGQQQRHGQLKQSQH